MQLMRRMLEGERASHLCAVLSTETRSVSCGARLGEKPSCGASYTAFSNLARFDSENGFPLRLYTATASGAPPPRAIASARRVARNAHTSSAV